MKSEFNSFENQWKKALESASVPPPDLVWDSIESKLDKKEKKRFAFLWWRNPALLSGIAAALVIGLTWVFVVDSKSKTTLSSIEVASMTTAESQSKVKVNAELKITDGKVNNKNLATLAQSPQTELKIEKRKKQVLTASDIIENNGKGSYNLSLAVIPNDILVGKEDVIATKQLLEKESLTINIVFEKYDLQKMEQRKFKNYANRFQPFRFYIAVDFEETVAEVRHSENNMWFGLNSGVAPFNPNYQNSGFTGQALASARNDAAFVAKNAIQSMPPSNTLVNSNDKIGLLPNSMPESSFRNGTAFNFGFSVGKKLRKRWGIESGLRYMQASAFLSSNVYAINQNTGVVNSFFYSNYLDSQENATQTVLSVNTTNKQIFNYFNVPLLLNYSLPIMKQLGIEALGGVSGDLFVVGNSDVKNPNSANLTAANSTFNLLNVSGMGGVRFTYDVNDSWEVNMGTTYQQALTSGVNSNQDLSFKPRTFGINYGLRYKMK